MKLFTLCYAGAFVGSALEGEIMEWCSFSSGPLKHFWAMLRGVTMDWLWVWFFGNFMQHLKTIAGLNLPWGEEQLHNDLLVLMLFFTVVGSTDCKMVCAWGLAYRPRPFSTLVLRGTWRSLLERTTPSIGTSSLCCAFLSWLICVSQAPTVGFLWPWGKATCPAFQMVDHPVQYLIGWLMIHLPS
jgi:hypothetical protein